MNFNRLQSLADEASTAEEAQAQEVEQRAAVAEQVARSLAEYMKWEDGVVDGAMDQIMQAGVNPAKRTVRTIPYAQAAQARGTASVKHKILPPIKRKSVTFTSEYETTVSNPVPLGGVDPKAPDEPPYFFAEFSIEEGVQPDKQGWLARKRLMSASGKTTQRRLPGSRPTGEITGCGVRIYTSDGAEGAALQPIGKFDAELLSPAERAGIQAAWQAVGTHGPLSREAKLALGKVWGIPKKHRADAEALEEISDLIILAQRAAAAEAGDDADTIPIPTIPLPRASRPAPPTRPNPAATAAATVAALWAPPPPPPTPPPAPAPRRGRARQPSFEDEVFDLGSFAQEPDREERRRRLISIHEQYERHAADPRYSNYFDEEKLSDLDKEIRQALRDAAHEAKEGRNIAKLPDAEFDAIKRRVIPPFIETYLGFDANPSLMRSISYIRWLRSKEAEAAASQRATPPQPPSSPTQPVATPRAPTRTQPATPHPAPPSVRQ